MPHTVLFPQAFIDADRMATLPDDLEISNYDSSCNASFHGSYATNVTLGSDGEYQVKCERTDRKATFILHVPKGSEDAGPPQVPVKSPKKQQSGNATNMQNTTTNGEQGSRTLTQRIRCMLRCK